MASPRRSAAKQPQSSSAVGDVFAAPVRGGFAACQIVRQKKDGALQVAALAYFGKSAPTLADLTPPTALRVTHHFWRGTPQALWIGKRVPREWQRIGTLPAVSVGKVDSYGYADAVPLQAPLQWHWDNCIPQAARDRYEACKAEDGENSISLNGEVVDWSALDRHGCLAEINYTGTDRGLLAFLKRSPIVRTVSWLGHGQERIDVSALDLDTLILDQAGPLVLTAGALNDLTIIGDAEGLSVRLPDAAALHLRLSEGSRPRLPVRGLEKLAYRLELQHVADVSFADIAGHHDLLDLEIVARPTTRFHDLASLSALSKMRKLEIRDGYRLDGEALSATTLPASLAHVVIRGYAKEHEAALRSAFAGVERFELSGGKDADWLVATLLNPFDWASADPDESTRATKAWATAIAAIAKAKRAGDRSNALVKFVKAFNLIHKRGVIAIDAARAAEVERAFETLRERAGVTERAGAMILAGQRKF